MKMTTLGRIFVHIGRGSRNFLQIKTGHDNLHIIGNQLPSVCHGIVVRSNERFYARRTFEDDADEEDAYWESPPEHINSRSRQSTFRSHNSFGQKRHELNHRHQFEDYPYKEKKSDYEPFLRGSGSKFDSQELGSKIKQKQWEVSKLSPLEKNFYVDHPSVAQRPKTEIDAFYKIHNITVARGDRPIPISHFQEANFPEELNQQLEKNGWTHPTPIQSLGWPLALSGKNMVGIAQTGSGKTLGFILPALVHIKHQRQVKKGEGPVALILAPTRELAQQIKSVAVQYGRHLGIRSCCIFGGQSKIVQARHLSDGPEIVVATPGRLLDFLEMEVINLDRTSYVVLDEADRMLDMGFEPQIRKVLSQIRPDKQMLMWSATWPKEIQQLASDFLQEFSQVNIGSVELMANPNIKQFVRVCDRGEKYGLLIHELKEASKEEQQKTLIFTKTKVQADFITRKLRNERFQVLAIHGDKSQLVRDKTLHSFRSGETDILVATDVASRGLDVNDIQLVINYDYPNTVDDYIHRIGRTARAAKTGTAVTFVTDEDAGRIDELIKVLKDANQTVPKELTELCMWQTKLHSKSSSKFRSNRQPFRPSSNRRNSW